MAELCKQHSFLFDSQIWKKISKKIILYRLNVTQLITLLLDSKLISVLCHMGDFGCGDGGWTPVMKMDGSKVNFSVVCLLVWERK